MNSFLSLDNLTLTQPFDTLIGIALFLSILVISFYISNKIKIHSDITINFFILSISFFVFVSFFISIIVCFKFNRDLIRFIIWILIIFIIIFFLINKFKFFNLKNLIINEKIIFIICFFLLSLIPPTDADSLDYHLGFPLDILRNQQFFLRQDWYHAKLSGISENLILLGLFSGSKNFGQLINFYGLMIILFSFRYLSKIFNSKIRYEYYIFSTALIVWMVASQKLSLFTSSIFCLILILIAIENKKIEYYQIIFIFLSLAFNIFSKPSNIIPGTIITCYVIIFCIKTNNFKFVKAAFLVSIFFILPYLLRNYYLTNDVYYPFMEIFRENSDTNFLEFYKSLTINYFNLQKLNFYDYFLIIVYYTIPINFLSVTTQLGLGTLLLYYLFYHIKKLFNKIEFIFVVLILIYALFIPNIQPRYFLEAYWVILIILIKYNIFENHIKFQNNVFKLLRLQSYFLLIFVIIGIWNLLPGSLSNNNYEKIMSKHAYNYNIINWINKNVAPNEIVVSNAVRSHALYKNYFVSREGFFRSNDLISSSKDNRISYFILEVDNKNFLSDENFDKKIKNLILKCGIKSSFKYYNYNDEVRNIFSKLKNINKQAVLIKNKCI